MMLKKVIRFIFFIVGGAVGVIFLPYLFDLFVFTSRPIINNAYIAATIGAAVFLFLSLFLTDPIFNFIKWCEDRLLNAPI